MLRSSPTLRIMMILFFGRASPDSAGEPPHLPSARDWESHQVTEGEVKTLRCPVDVNTRLYRWYHGQTEISPSLHPEYQLVGRRLVIKSFSDRLKGRYTCKAVNGFGSASYSFLLSVGGGLIVEDVLVPGVLLNLTASPGSSPTLACKLQSQQRSLELVWARREEPDHRLPPSVSQPLLLIDNHLHKRLQPSAGVKIWDKFLLELSGPVYQHSLQIVEVRPEDAGHYVCAVYRKGSLLDHQVAYLNVSALSPVQPSSVPPPDLTIVLAVLGSVVLILLIVLVSLLCRPAQTKKSEPKRNIPSLPKENQFKVQDNGELTANFI